MTLPSRLDYTTYLHKTAKGERELKSLIERKSWIGQFRAFFSASIQAFPRNDLRGFLSFDVLKLRF